MVSVGWYCPFGVDMNSAMRSGRLCPAIMRMCAITVLIMVSNLEASGASFIVCWMVRMSSLDFCACASDCICCIISCVCCFCVCMRVWICCVRVLVSCAVFCVSVWAVIVSRIVM